MNKKKRVWIVSLVFLINGVALIPLGFFTHYDLSQNYEDNSESNKFLFDNIRISDYRSDISGNGEPINITLHQSLINSSIISFTDFHNTNSFTEPSPTATNFNSSFINVTFSDIKADNITSIVRDGIADAYQDTFTNSRVTSFKVDMDCWLINFTLDVSFTANKYADVYLHKSTWNSGTSASIPSGTPMLLGTIPANSVGPTILDFTDQFLNTTLTDNNTWFIGLNGSHIKATWGYTNDGAIDNSYAYLWNAGFIAEARDYLLAVELGPVSITPSPEQISLKINNTQVTGYGDGIDSGYWLSTDELQDLSGILNFTLVSDWKATSLNITEVQINYTKTDLKAEATFEVIGSGQDIFWNVTRNGGINFFDSNINNCSTINFTIPSNWGNINASNGGDTKIIDTSGPIINGYKNIQVLGAENGTFWYLNASSSNLLSSIDMFIGLNPITSANFTDIVHFNASFSEQLAQNDGIINLSVYSPLVINNKLNYTYVNSTFDATSIISLGDWDISENVSQYGDFRIQISWNNNTAAGFLEKVISIIGETDMLINYPPENSEYYADEVFNITVYYNDTKLNQGISGGVVNVDVNGTDYLAAVIFDIGNGSYNITVNCSDSIFSSLDWFVIRLNVSKQYYNNQSEILNIKILTIPDTTKPNISINSPTSGGVFNATAPNFEVVVTDEHLNKMWYTIDNGVTNITFTVNGTIDQGNWTNHVEGSVTLIFYANDSSGNINSSQVIVIKDITNPSIDSIDSPTSGAWINSSPPSYNLSIIEANLDDIWYTLDGGVTNNSGGLSGMINSTAWSNANQGAVLITFYVNDSAGNWDSASVGINKDTIDPSIDNIDSPTSGAWFNNTPPSYNLSITEVNMDRIWYTLNGGLNNYTGTLSGIIDSTAWSNANQDAVTIMFYVNDSAGNWDSANIGINKDTINPSIDVINSPQPAAWVNNTPPSYNLSITEVNLDEIWYTLDGGINNYTGALSGIIDSTAWSNANQDAVTIIFYVNDSAGNWDSSSVGVNKDTINPLIDSIDSPSSGTWFNSTPPSYNLSITEINLDTIWYTLDGGINNYSGALSGIIDTTAWSNANQDAVTIIFYVNDSAGNWDSSSVGVNKDTINPSIDSIDSPASGAWFNNTPPSYNLSITEVNMDRIWYTLDGGINNYSGALSGIIDATAWSNSNQGSVTIIFYVNDSAGNWDSASIGINKDDIAPSIDSIDSPSSGMWFNNTPPIYNLSITEGNIDEIWYTLDGGINNYTGALGGIIDATAWSNSNQGSVTITFYVNDSAGNWDSTNIEINKDDIAPSIDSIDSPSAGAWFNGTPPSYNLSITETNLDTIWYTLDGGINNYTGTMNGTINSTAWSNANQGVLTLIFYVNDSAGNLDSVSVGINKDTINPLINSIDSPTSGTWFNNTPPNYNLSITETNLDTIWYTLDGGINNYTGAQNGPINPIAWANANQGVLTITFYVNDSAGNLDSASVGINKDTIDPSIDSIDSPSSGAWFNNTSPSYNLSITETNLETIWYTLDGGINNYTGSMNGVIDSTAWSNAGQGSVTITFYVNDTAGNLDSGSIGLNKDTIDPSINSIDSPFLGAWFNNTPPSYSLSITETNLDVIWYTLDGGINNYTGSMNGNINSTAWGNANQGALTITFYINDSAGNLDTASVEINKDTINPSIDSINAPVSNSSHSLAPGYNLSITEVNLEEIWYTLDGGATNYTGAISGIIDSGAWNNIGQGNLTITFYVNDSASNWNSTSVEITKIIILSISINLPNGAEWFNNNPNYDVSISGNNRDSIWYSLDGGITNYTITNNANISSNWLGTIDSNAWNNANQGSITITFYLNNTLGMISSDLVQINKDSIDPLINSINSPSSGAWFNSTPPNYNLSVTEINLETIWYTLDGGISNYTGSLSGTIDTTAWSNASQGPVMIIFYVNDTGGNLISLNIGINKDSIDPSIDSINSPFPGSWFNSITPSYNLSITEVNLNVIWYTLDGGINNYTGSLSGTIDFTAWSNSGQDSVTITFYVNDTAGNLISASVGINKDTINPSIDSIDSPSSGTWFNNIPPNYSLSITEANLEEIWYTLDGDINNYTGSLNGTIDVIAWSNANQGALTITFYINDSAGNLDSVSVGINKDTLNPSIDSINSPLPGGWFSSIPPNYSLSITEANLENIWYTLDGGVTNYTGTLSGVINLIAWNNAPQGSVILVFYANDTTGHVGSTQVIVKKDTLNPSVFIITPLGGEIFNISAPTFEVNIYDSNLDLMWYTIDDGITNITFTLNGTIDQDSWNTQLNGPITIKFYGLDSSGNINSSQVNIIKMGMMSYETINLMQYGRNLDSNGSIFKAFLNGNITIILNLLSLNPNEFITGAFGNLTFNNKSYFDSDIDDNGIYIWEINTSLLDIGSYSFIISFNKIYFYNSSFEIFFEINKIDLEIEVINPSFELKQGDTFNLTLGIKNLLTGDPIPNLNISLLIDFGNSMNTQLGTSQEGNVYKLFYWNLTSTNGLVTFYIFIPLNATKLNITIQSFGDDTFSSSEIIISFSLNTIEEVQPPSISLYVILIVGAIIGTGILTLYIKNKRKPMEIADEIESKQGKEFIIEINEENENESLLDKNPRIIMVLMELKRLLDDKIEEFKEKIEDEARLDELKKNIEE